jgi:hypothetical protein
MSTLFVRLIFFLLVILGPFAYAQTVSSADTIPVSSKSIFQQREFGKYFISDIYAPITSVQVGTGLNLKEYNISSSRSAVYVPYNETTLGVEIPIYQFNRTNRSGLQTKLSLSIPISAQIWFDFFEKATAPILNTDYRFGVVELNFLKEINRQGIRNLAIKFIPFFHESTHIGDEVLLYRVLSGFPIRRVNVSYEVAELAVTVNDPNGSIRNNHALKLGVRGLLNPSKGWYSVRSIEADTTQVVASKKWWESYVQYQHQRSKGFLASKRAVSVISVEIRNRVRFGYPSYLGQDNLNEWASLALKEDFAFCFNGYLGWKFSFDSQKFPKLGSYIRWYTGINPHGQFRNIPFYDFLGFALVYEN